VHSIVRETVKKENVIRTHYSQHCSFSHGSGSQAHSTLTGEAMRSAVRPFQSHCSLLHCSFSSTTKLQTGMEKQHRSNTESGRCEKNLEKICALVESRRNGVYSSFSWRLGEPLRQCAKP
jgi:hypothetical protein